jgi:hypothetical protein
MNRTISVQWKTEDARLNESLGSSLSAISPSPYCIYLFGTHDWLVKSGEAVEGLIYQHIYNNNLDGEIFSINSTNITVACGENMNAYAISIIKPVYELLENMPYLCPKCATHAEMVIWTNFVA